MSINKKYILQTEGLGLREACVDDADFILTLINQPAWKQFISDHSITEREEAQDYIETKL